MARGPRGPVRKGTAAGVEGSHTGGRQVNGVVVGSQAAAASQRRQAQQGAAASARIGQATRLAAAKATEARAIAKEVARARKQGTALVQASLERLQTAERSWDKHVDDGGVVIDGYPTEDQVLTYMATMSRSRQRLCLAQRGRRRKGRQNDLVRNYVAEMANNLWATKYPSVDELADAERKRYWSTIFTSYQAMYASASQPVACEEGEERAEQLVAQTERVYQRQHCTIQVKECLRVMNTPVVHGALTHWGRCRFSAVEVHVGETAETVATIPPVSLLAKPNQIAHEPIRWPCVEGAVKEAAVVVEHRIWTTSTPRLVVALHTGGRWR